MVGKRKKTMFLFFSKKDRHYTINDMKSLVVDRNEKFVNSISSQARENLLKPRGENALTWNFFRTLTISHRWDILFRATDLKTGKPLNTIITPAKNRIKKSFFWNIAPSTGEFNYDYAKALFYEDISFMGEECMIEPDFLGVFDNFYMLGESKLNCGFDICHKCENGKCKSKFHCNHFKSFMHTHWRDSDFKIGTTKDSDCYKFNQFVRNLRIVSILCSSAYRLQDVVVLNILNEKSRYFNENLQKCIDF